MRNPVGTMLVMLGGRPISLRCLCIAPAAQPSSQLPPFRYAPHVPPGCRCQQRPRRGSAGITMPRDGRLGEVSVSIRGTVDSTHGQIELASKVCPHVGWRSGDPYGLRAQDARVSCSPSEFVRKQDFTERYRRRDPSDYKRGRKQEVFRYEPRFT